PEMLGAAWDEAFASDRPVVLEAYTDPNVPPLPPHITLKQAKDFGSAVLKGDEDRVAFVKESVKEMVAGVLPGRGS
ncbi:MAG TPA: thiamine pyrophosphate-requiring protein, partial [Dehalococcoidia bacterium]